MGGVGCVTSPGDTVWSQRVGHRMTSAFNRSIRWPVDHVCSAKADASPTILHPFILNSIHASSYYFINAIHTAFLHLSGELIVSKYVAESITMIAGCFGHEGLCGRNILQSLLLILLRICSRSVRPISTK